LKLSLIIPVFNEAPTAATLLDQVLAIDLPGWEKEIVVIESGSTDGTTEIVKKYEGKPGVRVVFEDKPRGKGNAVKKGLSMITGDVVLIQDADLEYKVSDYPKLLHPFSHEGADIVFGSRALDPKQRWQYRQFEGLWEKMYGRVVNWGGLVYTILFNVLYGTRLSDGSTMFKLYRRKVLEGMELKSNGFDYDWEMQAKAAKRGFLFTERIVSYKARSRDEGKKIRFWRDGWLVFAAIVRYRFCD
jgi:glycosyltransferase involved in cell wall biosynthesis